MKSSRRTPPPGPSARRPERTPARVPGATYRLQFNAQFTFAQAREILPYLRQLGITDVYASPVFQARAGSTHGYDVCCFSIISPALGGEESFQQFAAAVRDSGMGLLLDIVPNHMGSHASNPWWWDVLKHGPASPFAGYFDIDWNSRHPSLQGKVLLPVLEDRLPTVLEAGKLKVRHEGGEHLIGYHDHRFPVAPQTPAALIERAIRTADASPHEVDAIIALLDAQFYRLAYWRVGAEEINYRRFFDVTELVALRMERPEVFAATHDLILELLADGRVTGLRVDHPDGLWDPRQYFERLQQAAAAARRADQPSPVYIVAEKILGHDESLPDDWPVAGTTGYDFLVQVNALFVADGNEPAMTRLYEEFTGACGDFAEIAHRSRRHVLDKIFIAEVDALTDRLCTLAAQASSGRDLTLRQLRGAIVELIACLPVYRTYAREESRELSQCDAEILSHAAAAACERAPGIREAIEFLLQALRAPAGEFVLRFQQLSGPAAAKGIEDTAFYRHYRLASLNEVGGDPAVFGLSTREFHERNRQRLADWPHSLLATSTHDTKRGEDARARLNVLSEDPAGWRAAVHRWREANSPCKTNVAGAPAPDANDEYLFYQSLVGAWPPELLQRAPLYPGLENFRERIAGYMRKAIREAKRHTSWTEPHAAYEEAMATFVMKVLHPANAGFLEECAAFARDVAFFGAFNSLSQTLLKITSPGVPDFYQGSELGDLSLVDPDNRRPVDYAKRIRLLGGLRDRADAFAGGIPGIFAGGAMDFEPVKLFVVWRALAFRTEHRELFAAGDYIPLSVHGLQQPHVCSFARSAGEHEAIVVVPRLVRTLTGGARQAPLGPAVWEDTSIAGGGKGTGTFRNVFTGETITAREGRLRMHEVLARFPVALLEVIR